MHCKFINNQANEGFFRKTLFPKSPNNIGNCKSNLCFLWTSNSNYVGAFTVQLPVAVHANDEPRWILDLTPAWFGRKRQSYWCSSSWTIIITIFQMWGECTERTDDLFRPWIYQSNYKRSVTTREIVMAWISTGIFHLVGVESLVSIDPFNKIEWQPFWRLLSSA